MITCKSEKIMTKSVIIGKIGIMLDWIRILIFFSAFLGTFITLGYYAYVTHTDEPVSSVKNASKCAKSWLGDNTHGIPTIQQFNDANEHCKEIDTLKAEGLEY